MKISNMVLPLFALYFAAILFLYYADFVEVPVRLVLGLILSFFLFVILKKKITWDNITLILIIYAIYSVILELVFLKMSLYDVTRMIILQIILPLITIHTIKAYADNYKKVDVLVKIIVVLMLINCLVVIGQFLMPSVFWNPRLAISETVPEISRPAGLAYYVIDFSYQMVALGTLAFIYFNKNKKKWLMVIPIIIIVASIFSLTRTCAFAMVLLMLLYWQNSKVYSRKKAMLFILLGGVLIGTFLALPLLNEYGLSRLSTFNDSSAEIRVPLAKTAIESIKNDPLGISLDEYLTRYSQEYTPHNQFLNTAVFFGIPALLLLIYFCYLLFKMAWKHYVAAETGDNKSINFILLLSLIGYTFTSLFHNAGYFQSNVEIYIIIGLILAINNIEKNKFTERKKK